MLQGVFIISRSQLFQAEERQVVSGGGEASCQVEEREREGGGASASRTVFFARRLEEDTLDLHVPSWFRLN